MISHTIDKMLGLIQQLKDSIEADIKDIKDAKHENLLTRNDEKHIIMKNIVELKKNLNSYLTVAMENNEDVNQYRSSVNHLEVELKHLYELNGKLASIVLPVQKMYKDIVDEIRASNGGSVFEIKA